MINGHEDDIVVDINGKDLNFLFAAEFDHNSLAPIAP